MMKHDFTRHSPKPRGFGKNLYLLGTSESGPYMEPVLISSKEQARKVFGEDFNGTLVKAFDEAYDNNREISIFLMRVTGTSATFEVVGANQSLDVVPLLFATSTYAGKKYNEVYFEVGGVKNTDASALYIHTPDGTFLYEWESYTTIGELVRRVNIDCREEKHTVLLSTDYPTELASHMLYYLNDAKLSGGDDGLYETRDDMYLAMDIAYELLVGQPIDIITPVGMFIDDVHPAYIYGTSVYGSSFYSKNRDYLQLVDTMHGDRVVTYHEQLIEFCRTQVLLGYMTHGVIGIRPLDKPPIHAEDDVSYILRIVETTSFRDRYGLLDYQNGYWIDKGFYISVVASELVFNKDTPEEYFANGAVRYASLLSGEFESTTNKSLGKDVVLRYEVPNQVRQDLSKLGVVTFRDSVRHGIVVTSGVTAAIAQSDYHSIANVRMLQLTIAFMNEAVDQVYESDTVSDMRMVFLDEMVKKRLLMLTEAGVITGHTYEIKFLSDASAGEIHLGLKTKYTVDGIIAVANIYSGVDV